MQTSISHSASSIAIFNTSVFTFAAAVCDQLEKAGVHAEVQRDLCGFVVRVPMHKVSESHQLLEAHPQHRECFLGS